MTYDLLIRNGPSSTGWEAAVRRLRSRAMRVIKAVGHVNGESAAREIDAAGLPVTPGFVDLHTHYDGRETPGSWPRAPIDGLAELPVAGKILFPFLFGQSGRGLDLRGHPPALAVLASKIWMNS